MNENSAFLIFMIQFVLWIWQFNASLRGKMLTPGQMNAHGVKYGLPFLGHGGMWGDLVLLGPLMTLIVYRFTGQWSIGAMSLALAIGFIGSFLLHFFVYVRGSLPSAHNKDGKLIEAGWGHLIYMAVGFAVFILFFFWTHNVSLGLLVLTISILMFHFFLGTNMILGIFPQPWFPEHPLRNMQGWITIFGIGIVAGIRGYFMLPS